MNRLKEVTSKLLQQISDLTEKSERCVYYCMQYMHAKMINSFLKMDKMFMHSNCVSLFFMCYTV